MTPEWTYSGYPLFNIWITFRMVLIDAADVTYGAICCLCFLIGSCGNMVSLLYFRSKKRDISSTIYMMITANDVVVSMLVLPVGLSYWSNRQPGLLFGNKYSCAAWFHIWCIAISFSIFLVMCLSITRTISLLRPFRQQNVRYLMVAVIIFILIDLIHIVVLNMVMDIDIVYKPNLSSCRISPPHSLTSVQIHGASVISFIRNMQNIAPAFVVATSCVISAVLLTRGNKLVHQREQQQSRNRATVTILLFALVYGICNVPLIVDNIIQTYCMYSSTMGLCYDTFYEFDTQQYYNTAMRTLLLATNSAANPILYFWRMPALRKSILVVIKRIQGRNMGSPQNDFHPNDPVED